MTSRDIQTALDVLESLTGDASQPAYIGMDTTVRQLLFQCLPAALEAAEREEAVDAESRTASAYYRTLGERE